MKDVDSTLDSPVVDGGLTGARLAAGFPVVGIGASAGGLAAFEAFFSAMPPDTDSGMSFVLVQHLAPDHKSILSDLVRRYTRMRVFDVEDGMKVQPNCAYIIPPNRDMAFLDGTLQLLDPVAPRGQRLPIDFFFRSLAQDQHERAICIVLSGTGSDGTLGVRAVKAEGGMVMAQSQESTEHDGMPRSAIATGLVDYVLPPAEMPAQLIAYARHAFGKSARRLASGVTYPGDLLKKVFVVLRTQTGHDFSGYKENTIARRVERRMAVHQIERLDHYLRVLQTTPAEVEALFRDLLIGVTSFFRDPEVFEALEKRLRVRILADHPAGTPLRVWVPGCSTGEEAYSIAILLQEQMEALKASFPVQVYATDLDSTAIDLARRGVYPASIAANVSAERLARFFVNEPDQGGYRIRKTVRDLLVFSEQNVIRDPPFSRLDLISCRNLMIYLGAELQKTLIPRFHYSLHPGGLLLLGSSETAGEFADLFAPLDRQARLYQRREDALDGWRQTGGSVSTAAGERRTTRLLSPPGTRPARAPLRELTERALLRHYPAVGVLVDGRGDILYLHGRTGQFLEPAPGEAGINILKMAREGLHHELAAALQKVVTNQELVRHGGLRVKTNGSFTPVDLTVAPVGEGHDPSARANLFLVILEAASTAAQAAPPAAPEVGATPDDDDAGPLAALRRDLQAKEAYLQTVNEELETSNEELRSSNEELQSVNEELQSSNEELETSKEELQSVNEELATVNAELQHKVVDLSRANNDMNNLLAGTDIGTLFVDHDLRIQRFTPSAVQVINLIQTDIGRPVAHIVSNLVGYDRLVEDLQAVLDNLIPREVEVQTRAGTWYSLRIRPYRTLENVIEGAVVTFIDIDEVKRMREAERQSEALRRLAVVVRDAHDAITVQDPEGRILAWNPGAERLFGWTEQEALARNILDLTPAGAREQALDRVRRVGQAEILEPHRTQRICKDGRLVEVWLIATPLVNDRGEAYAVATTERAIGSPQDGGRENGVGS